MWVAAPGCLSDYYLFYNVRPPAYLAPRPSLSCILIVHLFRTRRQPDEQQDERSRERRDAIREEDQIRPLPLAEHGEQPTEHALTDDRGQEFDERQAGERFGLFRGGDHLHDDPLGGRGRSAREWQDPSSW